ncbi:flagellar motor protein MotD [Pseudomonas sp. TTU2014-080ASC]|uniref:flagellar motor protein MotD n=1 Tax=Pseudomonas sp. TTU2014-080ASC TaxID=1729724 RepID=UPI0007184585|nr:flagellar motor protein MotD [Pseudomonas sp. TTU2014-080ASC]KRW59483.1 flagellar motor protein MotD [Pseudomonas sp. TTU2014-080ASC]
MARRRQHEEHENHERWLVSYADFITLLFAFFVVMYSISSINEGKYKILSDSLTGVFSEADRAIKPIPVGDERPRTTEPDRSLVDENSSASQVDSLERIANSVREAFGDLIKSDQLKISGSETWIEIELSSSLLFGSGDAIPNNDAFEIIERVAKILAPYENPIQVEGFTDDQPIQTATYPTNWELSTARAASVVRMLAMDGVNPRRLAAVGYGEHQPVTANDTPEGRARNRRVVLVVSRDVDVRRSHIKADDTQSSKAPAVPQAGTQSAPAPVTALPQVGAVKSPSPVL